MQTKSNGASEREAALNNLLENMTQAGFLGLQPAPKLLFAVNSELS